MATSITSVDWQEYWKLLDALFQQNGITHFTAREVSKNSIKFIDDVEVLNQPAPDKYWPNFVVTLKGMETLRIAIGGHPIYVTSGYRCPKYNKACGGVPNSQHLYCRAVDFYSAHALPHDMADKLHELYPQTAGIGKYRSFTHFDTRVKKARWPQRLWW